jgi:hypothetical protein
MRFITRVRDNYSGCTDFFIRIPFTHKTKLVSITDKWLIRKDGS